MQPNDFIVRQIQKLQGGDSGFFRELNSDLTQTMQALQSSELSHLLQPLKAGSKKKRRRAMLGGRRTDEERETAKCHGQEDFRTLSPIGPHFAIRLKENNYYYCFDVRSLHELLKVGNKKNPYTNEPFSQSNLYKIQRKLIKLNIIQSLERAASDYVANMDEDSRYGFSIEWIRENIIYICYSQNLNVYPPTQRNIDYVIDEAIQECVKDRLDSERD